MKKYPHCPKCWQEGVLNEEFDTYFCEKCVQWLEEECSDPNCKFCTTKPTLPKMPAIKP